MAKLARLYMQILLMARLHMQLLLLASFLTILAALSFNAAYGSGQIWKHFALGLMGSCFLLGACAFFWIYTQRPNPRQSLIKVTIHFLIAFYLNRQGKFGLRNLLASCKDPMKHQRRLWKEIVKINGNAIYGKDHRLKEMTSLEEFRRRHPLTGYEHFRPYVDRMMEGERDILINGSPDSYIRTTGTTGKSKYIPLKDRVGLLLTILGLFNYVARLHYPSRLLGKELYFYVAPKISRAKSGARIETGATMPEGREWSYARFVTPSAGYRIQSMRDALYVHLLFGLFDRDLGVILVGFVHFLESAMALLEKEWRNLVVDVERGTLNSELELSPEVRNALTQELQQYGGDPERSSELRQEIQKGFRGIIRRIWPRISVLIGIDSTGSWPRLRDTYAEGLALFTGIYGCSEAMCGISPGPKYITRGYIPMTDFTLFEFIREEEMFMDKPQAYFLHELEKNQNYEVVVTQAHGLYRYRMGDVVRVTSFYQNMPVIDFLYRTGQMLNLRYEKLDQRVVLDSIRAATAQWPGKTLIEFAVAESTIFTKDCLLVEPDEMMPFYVFFLEMADPSIPLSDVEKKLIETELRHRNSDFERLRRESSISHPRVRVVRPGAFAELESYLLANTGASANQYKVPRKLRTYAMVEVMIKNLVS